MNIFDKARIYCTISNFYRYSKELDQLLERLIQEGEVQGAKYDYGEVIFTLDNKKYVISTEGFPIVDLDRILIYNGKDSNLYDDVITSVRPSKKMKIRFWEFLEKQDKIDAEILKMDWMERTQAINRMHLRELLKG